MLSCVYHPTQSMRVVEDEERNKLLASGWFNSPLDAKNAGKVKEQNVVLESKPKKQKTRKENSYEK